MVPITIESSICCSVKPSIGANKIIDFVMFVIMKVLEMTKNVQIIKKNENDE